MRRNTMWERREPGRRIYHRAFGCFCSVEIVAIHFESIFFFRVVATVAMCVFTVHSDTQTYLISYFFGDWGFAFRVRGLAHTNRLRCKSSIFFILSPGLSTDRFRSVGRRQRKQWKYTIWFMQDFEHSQQWTFSLVSSLYQLIRFKMIPLCCGCCFFYLCAVIFDR